MAANEDWETLARNVAALERLSLIGGPFVLEGCVLTFSGSGAVYNMTAGTMVLNGKLHSVSAQAIDLVPDKGIRAAAPTTAYSRPFTALAQNKAAALERPIEVVLASAVPAGKQMLTVTTARPVFRTLGMALQDATRRPGEIALAASIADFDPGTGIGSGPWLGWRLCNGVAGTPDLRNRLPLGAGGAFAPGDTFVAPLTSGDAAIAVGFAQYVGFNSYWKNA